MIADLALGVGTLVILAALAISLWLAYSAQMQVRQLRQELDQSQSILNAARNELGGVHQQVADLQRETEEMRRELNDLRAAAEVLPPPPPLPRPRSRSGGLEDLREQLRAAHREEEPPAEE